MPGTSVTADLKLLSARAVVSADDERAQSGRRGGAPCAAKDLLRRSERHQLCWQRASLSVRVSRDRCARCDEASRFGKRVNDNGSDQVARLPHDKTRLWRPSAISRRLARDETDHHDHVSSRQDREVRDARGPEQPSTYSDRFKGKHF